MKFNVHLVNQEKPVESYQVDDISKTDFTNWPGSEEEPGISLSEIRGVIDSLSPAGDPLTPTVDAFLPLHVKDKVESLNIEHREAFTAKLNMKSLLLKVIEEICHNHRPLAAFVIRIYD